MTGLIMRYTFAERVNHWVAGFSYLYLLMSGLAFYTPYLYWMATILGGGPAARFWHPWIGLVFTGAMIWMHSAWRIDMKTTDADRRWSREVRKYIENRDDEVPPVGRFNPGQKQFYWAMFFAAGLLLLSGLVMWLPEYVPAGLRWARAVAVVTHEIAALVTIGAFIIHVYMGLFAVPGGFRAILHGHVTAEWARAHHRLWYERLTRRA